MVENIKEAKGTARMNGTRIRVVGVGGKVAVEGRLGEGWRIGSRPNWIRRRVRPMASGRERRSSSPRVGLEGSSWRSGVRV